MRAMSIVFAIVAIGFFAAPIALRAAGTKAVCCPENHPFAPAPKLADGWDVLDETTRYLVDRMPGRERAVRANNWISRHIWATTPNYGPQAHLAASNDQALPFSGHPAQDTPGLSAGRVLPSDINPVAAGIHGWMFLQGAIDHVCRPDTPIPTALDRWLELLKLIRDSGRRVVLVVAADKSTIYPELVQRDVPNLACGRRGSARLWAAVESRRARAGGIVALRKPLLTAKAANHDPIYFPMDSHWNDIGALTLVRTAVPAIDPRLHPRASEVIDTGRAPHVSDMSLLQGDPRNDIAPTRAVRRAPGSPVISGPSLFLGDSFSYAPYPELAPYFRRLRHIDLDAPAQIVRALPGARNVVLEVAERQFVIDAAPGNVISPHFLTLVRRALGHR